MSALAAAAAAALAVASEAPQPTAPAADHPATPAFEVEAAQPESDKAEGFSPLDVLDVLDLDFHVGPFTFHGYLQYDAAAYDQAPEGPPEEDFRRGGVRHGDPLRARNLEDGPYLRRARLGGEGTYGRNIAFRAMFELGAGDGGRAEPRIAEVWVSYRKWAPWVVAAGAFPQLANMEGATSSDGTLFLERATAADLSRSLGSGDGRIGIQVRRSDRRGMLAVSLTGPLIDSGEDYSPRSAVVARALRTVRSSPNGSVHLGVNGTYVLQLGRKEQVGQQRGFPARFLATPELDVDNTPLIDTGDILADRASVIGAELAAQHRNLFLQAEAFRFGVKRQEPDLADPHFFGFYVQGSWILTGERRRYDASRGAFSFPKPDKPIGQGGWGAFEVALRYSRMDLNYRAGSEGLPPPAEGVRGGDQKIWSAALLWYPRPRVRIMATYLRTSIDRLNPARPADAEPFGPPPATPPTGVQIGQNLSAVAVRLRYSF